VDLVRTFKALSDPTRLRILAAVAEDELTVGEVRRGRGLGQSAVSRNLAILGRAGFVRTGGRARTSISRSAATWRTRRKSSSIGGGRLCRSAESRRGPETPRPLPQKRTRRSRGYFEAIGGRLGADPQKAVSTTG